MISTLVQLRESGLKNRHGEFHLAATLTGCPQAPPLPSPGKPVYYVVFMQRVWRNVTYLKYWLKLTVMISQSVHMMTSQGRICVLCVTNGLQGKTVWMITNAYTVERNRLFVQNVRNVSFWEEVWIGTKDRTAEEVHIHVLSVRNRLEVIVAWEDIWMSTAVNTSALNVVSVLMTITI